MPPYQQQPPVAQGWDRWQQHQHTSSDYSMMDHMVTYDPRAVPSTTALQRPALTAQYSMPTSYTDSPVTPMSTSSYGTASHFADYQPYAYQGPTPSTNFSQVPLRGATRPMAPPTPPLDEERGLRLGDGHNVNTVKSTLRKSPRRSASVVKSEVGGEDGKEIKTCAVLIKEDRTLQFESKKFVDVLLKKAATRKQPGDGKGDESTPESAATPVPDDVCLFRCTSLWVSASHANITGNARMRDARSLSRSTDARHAARGSSKPPSYKPISDRIPARSHS